MFDYNGTGSTDDVLDHNGDPRSDIVVLGRWNGDAPSAIGLNASDFWFDIDTDPSLARNDD